MNTRAIADLRGLGPKSQAMLAGAGIKTVAQLKRLGNILAWLFCGLSANAAMAIDLAPLWDFERPDVSEQRFRNALEKAAGDDALILRTQIARTYGLRKDFDGARKLLREIEPAVGTAGPEAKVRFHLELGRTFASAAHSAKLLTSEAKAQARQEYDRALEQARAAKLDGLAIDAIHMFAFIDTEPHRVSRRPVGLSQTDLV